MSCCCSPQAAPPPVAPQLAAPLAAPQWPTYTPVPIGLPNSGQPSSSPPQEFVSGAIGAAASVTFTASFQTRGGRALIWAELSANASAAAGQTGTLRLDVAGADTVLDNALESTAAAGAFQMSFFATTVLTPGAHTLSVRAVASAGTNTVAAGNAKIMIQEL